jgi:hypothetical protein
MHRIEFLQDLGGFGSVSLERASYNGSIEASQASDVGSIPIARSRNPVDAVGLTGFPVLISPIISWVLDVVGREIRSRRGFWTRLFGRGEFSNRANLVLT